MGAILCTGRHPLELKQLDLLKYRFDGFVLLNGQLVLDKNMNVISARTIGIAMGNAPDNVKAEADYVTDRVEDNGIWNALMHFGVI